jgi:hypothetical protein
MRTPVRSVGVTPKKVVKKPVTRTVAARPVVKTLTAWYPMIFSRHPSHKVLKKEAGHIRRLPVPAVVRLGSTTEVEDSIAKGGRRIEVNTTASIRNSSSKLLMKRCFDRAGAKTAPWVDDVSQIASLHDNWKNPIVAKGHYGSKGRANTLIRSQAEFDTWRRAHGGGGYLFEKFMNYGHEFRFHITSEGCFYACRKALKADTPESEKWRRHDDNCAWLLETNPEFHRPNSYDAIVRDCVAALREVGADVLSFDIRVQSNTVEGRPRREQQDYILLECNSASSMDNGTGNLSVCAQKYIEEIPRIILRKAGLSGRN